MCKNQTTALIVDDEPLARQGMRDLLQVHPEIKVTGEAARLAEAREQIAQSEPDLIFLDIQLYGECGFDLLEDLSPKTNVIFITAFDQYAVRAFEVNALDYLLKPVQPERLKSALARHESHPNRPKPGGYDRIYLTRGRKRWFEPAKKIRAICANGDHSSVWLTDNREVVVRRSLNEWEKMLSAESFMRIHRNSIVNLTAVCHAKAERAAALILQLSDCKKTLQVSRRRVAEFRRRCAKI
jgi:two-component system LytT family response regulator